MQWAISPDESDKETLAFPQGPKKSRKPRLEQKGGQLRLSKEEIPE
jgi:hypothetical protein